MGFKCPNCSKKIKIKYINEQKNIEMLKCPSCKIELIESKKTKILTILIAVMPIILLVTYVPSTIFRILFIFVWAFFVNLQIRPLIASYIVEEKDKKGSIK